MKPRASRRERGPVVLKFGDAAQVLRGPSLRYVVLALANYAVRQDERIQEALDDGNADHARSRAKVRRMIDDVLDFLSDAVDLPSWYHRAGSAPPTAQEEMNERSSY